MMRNLHHPVKKISGIYTFFCEEKENIVHVKTFVSNRDEEQNLRNRDGRNNETLKLDRSKNERDREQERDVDRRDNYDRSRVGGS